MTKYYHIISDDSYWSIADAIFVPQDLIPTDIDVETEITDLPDLSELRVCLDFYGYPMGEMATSLDRITALQTKFAPDFIALDTAALSAMIDGDQEVLAEIAAEKAALRARMSAEIQTIQEEV